MKLNKSNLGFTLAETIIATSIFVVISAITVQIFNSINETHLSISSEGLMQKYDQKGMNNLSKDISAARIFIGRKLGELPTEVNSYSKYYLNKIPLSLPINTNSGKFNVSSSFSQRILPVIDDSTNVTKIKDYPERIGNSLIVGVFDDSTNVSWTEASITKSASIDLLSLRYYFLAEKSGNKTLEVIRWESVYYADYTQINNILNSYDNHPTLTLSQKTTTKTNFINSLKAINLKSSYNGKKLFIGGVWKPDDKEISTNKFFKLELLSGVLKPEDTTYLIPMLKASSLTNSFNQSNYSIARNNDSQKEYNKVPLFTTATTNFPNGFEVFVAGQSGARQVFARLVSESRIRGTKKTYNQTTMVSTGKDS